jgi:hypothetical protein
LRKRSKFQRPRPAVARWGSIRVVKAFKEHGPAGLARIAMFAAELLAVDVRLRCLPYRFNRLLLSPGCAGDGSRAGFRTRTEIERLARQVTAAARFSLRDGDCLRRAVVLCGAGGSTSASFTEPPGPVKAQVQFAPTPGLR